MRKRVVNDIRELGSGLRFTKDDSCIVNLVKLRIGFREHKHLAEWAVFHGILSSRLEHDNSKSFPDMHVCGNCTMGAIIESKRINDDLSSVH